MLADDLAERWLDNGLVTEVHLQSEEQRATNVTGPMVSLLHGLLGYGKYLGGLTCLADPVGVPTLGGRINVNGTAHSSFMDGADYKVTSLWHTCTQLESVILLVCCLSPSVLSLCCLGLTVV